jgi:hypothetical protein
VRLSHANLPVSGRLLGWIPASRFKEEFKLGVDDLRALQRDGAVQPWSKRLKDDAELPGYWRVLDQEKVLAASAARRLGGVAEVLAR